MEGSGRCLMHDGISSSLQKEPVAVGRPRAALAITLSFGRGVSELFSEKWLASSTDCV